MIAWAMVRHRFASFAGTFVAVLLGVAVVAGSVTLYLSSRPQPPERYRSSPVMVQAPSVGTNDFGEPEIRSWTTTEMSKISDKLRQDARITAVIPDPVFYVQEDGVEDEGTAKIDGHAWSSAALGGYHLSAGREPGKPGEVVAARAVNSRLEVLTARGPETWTVVGTTDGPGFYVTDDDALGRASGVRVIGLLSTGDPADVASGAQALLGAAGTVRAGPDRAALEPNAVTRIRWIGAQLLIALVTLGAFATVFVVASTCALTAAQRRRELGLLRAAGATPGQVRRMLYAETALIALIAGLVGAPLGTLLAPLLAEPMVDFGLEPPGYQATWQPAAVGGAILLGLLVALAGVAVAARRASKVPPLAALREAAAETRAMTPARWVAGLLVLAAGGALLAAMPGMPTESKTTTGMGAAMLLLTAAALLAPVVIGPLVRLATGPWRGSATGMVVREGTLTGVRRVASTAAPVLVTVGITVLLTGMIATIEEAAGIDGTAEIPAATVLAPDGTPGLSEAAVQGQPGTSRLATRVLITRGQQTVGEEAAGVPGAPVTVTPEAGVALGAPLQLRWADGTTQTLTVRRIDPDAVAPIVLPRELVRGHDPDALTGMVVLTGDPHPAAGARALTARDYVQEEIDEEGRLVDLFLWVLIGLTAGYTAIAVSNTLLMATAARRPEFRALRLAGAGLGQVLRITTAEAVLAAVTGALLGGAVGGLSLTGVRAAVEDELGQDVALVIPWDAALGVAALCALLAVVATAVPVLRRRALAG
ncbi:putative ABC transport system permease protein [Actinoplanes octamycinicus]|uniref:Putative ABC transport system permease protein n=1 Tax=Actinoplanes octamycinicus TaxID=135948 RepID=A0A7W7H5K5_9ACTN|nr:ABC transporter permease [Actinoplanes octamycinicus]MBB4744433.1 putative ABC transport system permease protein [Actinoplanes octamycinicus]GIE61649.1 ABC transporter permease [Actinoplanes octamycinicus]